MLLILTIPFIQFILLKYTFARPNITSCITTINSSTRNPCIFPFWYKGILRNGCITEDDPDGWFWCSTNIDENGKHIPGKRNWGYCSARCPTYVIN